MEKLKREKVMKGVMNGGKGMVCIETFLVVKYVSMCARLSEKENVAGCMVKYACGSVLRKYKLCEIDLRKPVCFVAPWFYVRIERCMRRYGLQDVKRDKWCESKKVMQILKEREEMEGIGGLRVAECKKVWKNVCCKGVDNRQKDIAWMGVHGCLPTREFQRRRRFVDSEVCPRLGCRGIERVVHVFWECRYAKKVWKRMEKMIEGLTGVNSVTYEMVLYGLCDLGRNEERLLWIVVNCIKECLWDVRNILIFKQEVVKVKECVAMVRGRIYNYAYYDYKKLGEKDARKLWILEEWKQWCI